MAEPADPSPLPAWVPAADSGAIDVGELAVIGNSEARALDHLSRELDCHIAAYRREARGEAEGLCRNYQAAELDGRQLRRLHSLSLVAFAKPLSRHWD